MPRRLIRNLTSRDKSIIRVLGITLVFNVLVAAAKIIVGLASGRLTIVADGFHSILDSGNNVLGVAVISVAARPPDKEHPYGHRKFENVAAMGISGVIVLIAWELLGNIIRTVWAHWQHGIVKEPEPAEPLFAAVLIGSIVVNLATAAYQTRRGRDLSSPLLIADARHTSSDSMITGFSLLSLYLTPVAWWFDPLLALIVCVFLVRAAWDIVRENLPAFTDHVQLDPDQVNRVVLTIDGVEQTSSIRSHGTVNDVHLDLTISVEPSLSAADVEGVEDAVREALELEYPGLTLIGIHHRAKREE